MPYLIHPCVRQCVCNKRDLWRNDWTDPTDFWYISYPVKRWRHMNCIFLPYLEVGLFICFVRLPDCQCPLSRQTLTLCGNIIPVRDGFAKCSCTETTDKRKHIVRDCGVYNTDINELRTFIVNRRTLFTGYLPGAAAPGIDYPSWCTRSCLSFLAADRTSRL